NPAVAGVYYELTQDIDCVDTAGWSAYGFSIIGEFAGHFNGNDYVIRNLTITQPSWDYRGLFHQTTMDSTIENLRLENALVQARNYVGGLVGAHYGELSNVAVHGVVSGSNSVGGLVGYNGGVINKAYSKGSVS